MEKLKKGFAFTVGFNQGVTKATALRLLGADRVAEIVAGWNSGVASYDATDLDNKKE